jgi:hypothetical protein
LTISNFAGEYSTIWVGDGATATLVGCSFIGNNVGIAVLIVKDADIPGVTVVRMEQCTFTSNKAELLSTNTIVYVDDATLDVIRSSGDSSSNSTYVTAPLSAQTADRQGLTSASAWFQSTREVRSSGTCLLHTSRHLIDMQP